MRGVVVSLSLAVLTALLSSATDTDVSTERNNKIRIATVTDTHIGEGCNGDLSYDNCIPVRALTDAVKHMNSLVPKLDGVFVTGDLTSSALKEEFVKIREILDALEMPYWPVLGNHDSWPYVKSADGSFTETDTPIGDQYFTEVFSDIVSGEAYNKKAAPLSTSSTQGWPREACLNQDFGFQSHFHNFYVEFPNFSDKFTFLALDWVARGSAAPYAGVGPEAELHNFPCGTMEWLSNTLSSHAERNKENRFFIMQHHPFRNRDIWDPYGKNEVKNFTFDDDQDKQIEQVLAAYYNVENYLGAQAGHLHRWFNGSAFTKYTAFTDSFLNFPEWETAACKGWVVDSKFLSAFSVFTFAKNASNNDNVFLDNVMGHWIVPSGEWRVKPVLDKGPTSA